jgi:hypothetical protein
MNEIDKIAQLIVQSIIYLMATGRILEATILMMIVYISFKVFMAFIKAFFGLFLPEQKTPEKEVKERVKVIYIVQDSAGNKIRIHKTEEDKETQVPPVKENKPKKLNILQRIIKTIQDIIVFIIKTILIIIIIALTTLLIGITIGFIVGYIKNPSL